MHVSDEQKRDWTEQGDLDRLHHSALRLLTTQLRIDLQSSVIAAVALAASSLWYQAGWGIIIAIAIVLMAGVRQIALPAVRRGNVAGAVAWTAAGTWGIAIIVVWIVPEVMPVMILNLVSPLINATTYCSEDTTRRFATGATAVAALLGLLGYLQDGTDSSMRHPAGLSPSSSSGCSSLTSRSSLEIFERVLGSATTP